MLFHVYLTDQVLGIHLSAILFTAQVSLFLQYFAELYEESRFMRLLLLLVFVSLLFILSFFPHHVIMTVLVTITKTGTITMTNRQLIQKNFPYLGFNADVFYYAYCESSASTKFLGIKTVG